MKYIPNLVISSALRSSVRVHKFVLLKRKNSEEMSSLARQKKKKEIIERVNRDTERIIRLSDCIPNLDFRPLKRDSKEEMDFIQHVKRQKYINENQQNISEDIKKIFERYIKENAKNIEIITVKEERVRFFDGEKENIGLTNFKGNMPTKRNIGGCRKNISWKGIEESTWRIW